MKPYLQICLILAATVLNGCGRFQDVSSIASTTFGIFEEHAYSYYADDRAHSFWKFGAGFDPNSKSVAIDADGDRNKKAYWSWSTDSILNPSCGTADYLGNQFPDHGLQNRPGGPIFSTSCQDVHRRVINLYLQYPVLTAEQKKALLDAGYTKVRIETSLDIAAVSTRADRMPFPDGAKPYYGKNIIRTEVSFSRVGSVGGSYSVRMDTGWHAETIDRTIEIDLTSGSADTLYYYAIISGTSIQFNQLKIKTLRAF